jgi:hypothetical protein
MDHHVIAKSITKLRRRVRTGGLDDFVLAGRKARQDELKFVTTKQRSSEVGPL